MVGRHNGSIIAFCLHVTSNSYYKKHIAIHSQVQGQQYRTLTASKRLVVIVAPRGGAWRHAAGAAARSGVEARKRTLSRHAHSNMRAPTTPRPRNCALLLLLLPSRHFPLLSLISNEGSNSTLHKPERITVCSVCSTHMPQKVRSQLYKTIILEI